MPTTKNRLNITLPRGADKALAYLSKRDGMPRATKATELLSIALELEEDSVLDSLASERDTPRAKFLSHKEVWK